MHFLEPEALDFLFCVFQKHDFCPFVFGALSSRFCPCDQDIIDPPHLERKCIIAFVAKKLPTVEI